jgi:hypothetical protein
MRKSGRIDRVRYTASILRLCPAHHEHETSVDDWVYESVGVIHRCEDQERKIQRGVLSERCSTVGHKCWSLMDVEIREND